MVVGSTIKFAIANASMEPRRHRRGDQATLGTKKGGRPKLQWSHDVTVVEIAVDNLFVQLEVLASMEPRRHRRGDQAARQFIRS